MTSLAELDGSQWAGTAELWMDPLGDEVVRSECTLSVAGQAICYGWSHEGNPQEGRIDLREGGADFSDTWHSPDAMPCATVPGSLGLFQVQGGYGPEDEWRWRVALSLRGPTGQLVLQMTNIAPWGEEARAVRMTFDR